MIDDDDDDDDEGDDDDDDDDDDHDVVSRDFIPLIYFDLWDIHMPK